MTKTKPVILSGIRPTGNLHLGNYLGALANFVRLQADYHCYFFIADLHALNEPKLDAEHQYDRILDTAAWFLAAGLDPKRSTLFVQSQVPAHSQLAVILANVVPVGYLVRMTQYKDKAAGLAEGSVNAGLLYYPVLMAADILLYHPWAVPVGDDQDQHVELSRDVAGFFNRRFGNTFRLPQTLHTPTPRVMSLQDPAKKMSKTLGGNHCLNLDDGPDEMAKKINRAVTDTGDGTSAGAKNLLEILRQFNPSAAAAFTPKPGGKISYAELKATLVATLQQAIGPMQATKEKLRGDRRKLERLLAKGAKDAAAVADETLGVVQRKVGIRR